MNKKIIFTAIGLMLLASALAGCTDRSSDPELIQSATLPDDNTNLDLGVSLDASPEFDFDIDDRLLALPNLNKITPLPLLSGQLSPNTCGDGICSEIEKFAGSCEKDCDDNDDEIECVTTPMCAKGSTVIDKGIDENGCRVYGCENNTDSSKMDPFCIYLYVGMPTFEPSALTMKSILVSKALGVSYTIHGSAILFGKGAGEDELRQKARQLIKHNESSFTIVPFGRALTEWNVKDFSSATIEAVQNFPEINDWLFEAEVDGGITAFNVYNEDENNLGVKDQHAAYKKKARRVALHNRIAYRIVKNLKPEARVASSGTIGYFPSYLQKGDRYVDPDDNKEKVMKRDSFYVYYMRALHEFESIEKNLSLYDWNKNEFKLSKEEFNIVFSPDKYSHYFDIHQYSDFDEDATDYFTDTNNLANSMQKLFKDFGYNDVELWITQTATHTGGLKETEMSGSYYNRQSESVQAGYVVKKYITSIVAGIKKTCWIGPLEIPWPKTAGGLITDSNYELDYEHAISQDGLIYDGRGVFDPGDSLPANDPNKVHKIKKLSYYTYKKMVDVLEGSDWNNIQTIQESDEVYIYKFTKNGKPIWVAWNDNFQSKTITLNVGNLNTVKITEAVPNYETGKEVTDYKTAFKTETKTVNNGQAILAIGENPIYVEYQYE